MTHVKYRGIPRYGIRSRTHTLHAPEKGCYLKRVQDNRTREIVAVTEFGEGLGEMLTPEFDKADSIVRWAQELPLSRVSLRSRVKDSWAAVEWAITFPEDRLLMLHHVAGMTHAAHWASLWPEDRDVMRTLLCQPNSPQEALKWATCFPEDRELMRTFVMGDRKDRKVAEAQHWWVSNWPEDAPYFK